MTSRIVLRALKVSDKANTFDLLTDADVMAFLGPRRALDKKEAQQWFEGELASPSRYVVALKENNELIGFCGMKIIDGIGDFGYFFRQKFWGKGYASESCVLVINKLKEQIDVTTLQVFIADQNNASLALAKKLNWLLVSEAKKGNEQGYYFQIRY